MPPAIAGCIDPEGLTLMATRSRTTFQKRQKEIARAEKQRDKVARRLQRKLNGDQGIDPDAPDALEASDEENLVNGVSAVDGSTLAAGDAPSAPNAPTAPEAASAPAAPAAAVGRS
jgi:hypothetical protein